MADVGSSLVALLKASAEVVAIVNDRIVPDQMLQGEAIPSIVYRVISTQHSHTISGAKAGIASSRITIECFATSRQAANELAEKVRLSGLLDWSGPAYGADVRDVTIDSGAYYLTEQSNDGSHELRYITSQDYQVHFIEAV